LLDDAFHTFGTFLGTGAYEVRTLPARLLVLALALFVVVILATYTGVIRALAALYRL
jgi:hypothetical protein